MWLDTDELVRILSAGVNIVSTAAFITGHNLDADRDRIVEACRAWRRDDVRIRYEPGLRRAARDRVGDDLRPGRQDHGQRGRGHHLLRLPRRPRSPWASEADRPPRPAGDDGTRNCRVRRSGASGRRCPGRRTRRRALQGRVRADHRRPRLGSWTIPAGCVAGVAASWKGSVGGRTLVELNVRWRKGQTLEPDWKIDQDGWVDPDRRSADGHARRRHPPAARLRGRDDRRLHGARPHHDGDAADQCDPGGRGRGTGHRDVQRSRRSFAPAASCDSTAAPPRPPRCVPDQNCSGQGTHREGSSTPWLLQSPAMELRSRNSAIARRRARDAGRAGDGRRRRSCTPRRAGVTSAGSRRPPPTAAGSRRRARTGRGGGWRLPARDRTSTRVRAGSSMPKKVSASLTACATEPGTRSLRAPLGTSPSRGRSRRS